MTVGADIEEVLEEVGASLTIIRASGNVTGEYLRYMLNAQVTKPFIREFFLEAEVSYQTAIVGGDIIYVASLGDYFIVMNKTPELLENEIYRYNIVLYKCNVQVDIYRPDDDVDWDSNYLEKISWSTIKSDQRALLTAPQYGAGEEEEPFGNIVVERESLYIPNSVGIKVGDRVVVGSEEYYKVESVRKRRFQGVDFVELKDDERPVIGSSVTTTSSTTTTTSSTTTTTTTTA